MTEFVGIARSNYDTYVVIDRGNGSTTTMPKKVYIDADYRPSYHLLPILKDGVIEDAPDA